MLLRFPVCLKSEELAMLLRPTRRGSKARLIFPHESTDFLERILRADLRGCMAAANRLSLAVCRLKREVVAVLSLRAHAGGSDGR